jgi:4-amino-4-deoxy-L-arabinose transferase-like glycosyltransferase
MSLKKDKINILILSFIILIGIFLRIQNINRNLERDESRFVETAINMDKKSTPLYNEKCLDNTITIFDHHPPLYLLILKNIVHFFGPNIIILRIFMVFFSVLSIILVYVIGSLLGKKEYGLLAAFILSIIRPHVEYSQQIDIDGSFLTFMFLLSSYFFVLTLKNKNKK